MPAMATCPQTTLINTRGLLERAARPPCQFQGHYSRTRTIFVGHYYIATKTDREGGQPAQVAPL